MYCFLCLCTFFRLNIIITTKLYSMSLNNLDLSIRLQEHKKAKRLALISLQCSESISLEPEIGLGHVDGMNHISILCYIIII